MLNPAFFTGTAGSDNNYGQRLHTRVVLAEPHRLDAAAVALEHLRVSRAGVVDANRLVPRGSCLWNKDVLFRQDSATSEVARTRALPLVLHMLHAKRRDWLLTCISERKALHTNLSSVSIQAKSKMAFSWTLMGVIPSRLTQDSYANLGGGGVKRRVVSMSITWPSSLPAARSWPLHAPVHTDQSGWMQ